MMNLPDALLTGGISLEGIFEKPTAAMTTNKMTAAISFAVLEIIRLTFSLFVSISDSFAMPLVMLTGTFIFFALLVYLRYKETPRLLSLVGISKESSIGVAETILVCFLSITTVMNDRILLFLHKESYSPTSNTANEHYSFNPSFEFFWEMYYLIMLSERMIDEIGGNSSNVKHAWVSW